MTESSRRDVFGINLPSSCLYMKISHFMKRYYNVRRMSSLGSFLLFLQSIDPRLLVLTDSGASAGRGPLLSSSSSRFQFFRCHLDLVRDYETPFSYFRGTLSVSTIALREASLLLYS